MEEVIGGDVSGENVLGELYEGNLSGGDVKGGGITLLPNYYISCTCQILATSLQHPPPLILPSLTRLC